MNAPLLVWDDLIAAFALKIDDFQLIAQISIHNRAIESVSFATWAAKRLVKPFLQTMVVENLLTVSALYVLFLHYVEADRTEERVDKLLFTLDHIFFQKSIVAS